MPMPMPRLSVKADAPSLLVFHLLIFLPLRFGHPPACHSLCATVILNTFSKLQFNFIVAQAREKQTQVEGKRVAAKLTVASRLENI